ncbi:MAG: ChbG/HpnK family deacetylase [Bdellovibrionales bacterium]|nr:ChbG/HpnK family deacetylase [Bdellovibrionales bacterium]
MHWSINAASLHLLEKHPSVRVSLMATGNYFEDAVERLKASGFDACGVHLTMNSEFQKLPTSPLTRAKSLCDPRGYFLGRTQETRMRAVRADIRNECVAQIEAVQNQGLRVTHLDSHMFFSDASVWGDSDLGEDIARLASQLGVPFRRLDRDNIIFVWESHQDFESRAAFYDECFSKFGGGNTEVILHPALDEASVCSFTQSGPRRVADYRYFLGSQWLELCAQNNVCLTPRGF